MTIFMNTSTLCQHVFLKQHHHTKIAFAFALGLRALRERRSEKVAGRLSIALHRIYWIYNAFLDGVLGGVGGDGEVMLRSITVLYGVYQSLSQCEAADNCSWLRSCIVQCIC